MPNSKLKPIFQDKFAKFSKNIAQVYFVIYLLFLGAELLYDSQFM